MCNNIPKQATIVYSKCKKYNIKILIKFNISLKNALNRHFYVVLICQVKTLLYVCNPKFTINTY